MPRRRGIKVRTGTRNRTRALLLRVLPAATLGFFSATSSVRAQSPAVVAVPDKLCFAGEEIQIEATLYRSGLLGLLQERIQGEVLCFFDPQGNPLRELLTDASGTARIRYKAGPAGRYVFTVRLRDNPRYSADPGSGTLFVQTQETPLFFVAVEAGLMPATPMPLPLRNPEKIVSEPGSAEALSQVAACHTVIYLTQDRSPSSRRIRTWLEEKGYPTGPVYGLHPSFLSGVVSGDSAPETGLLESLWKERSVPAYLLTRDRGLAEAAADKGLHVLLFSPEDSSDGTPEKPSRERLVPVHEWPEIPGICRCKAR